MSIMTATWRPSWFDTSRTRLIMDPAQAPDPCAMFRRMTSTPAAMIRPNRSTLSVAGPRVAMILVCR